MSTRQNVQDREATFGIIRWGLLVATAFVALAFTMSWLARSMPLPAPAPEGAGEVYANLTTDFRLASLEGPELGPPDYLGKVVVIDFWASWCGPCRLQAKFIEEVHRELPEEEVQFLAINVGEDLETVRQFTSKTPFPYPVLLDPDDTLAARYQIFSLPTVMILDPEGKITFMQRGVSNSQSLRQAIEQAGGQAGSGQEA